MRRIPAGTVVAATALLVGCHTITEELPTQPTSTVEQPSTGLMTVAIPALNLGGSTPAPTPTPTPAPPSTPAPTPPPPSTPAPVPPPPSTPAPVPPAPSPPAGAGGCGEPLPGPIVKVKAYVHIRGANRYTLDSTPLVAGGAYCAAIGYTDGRTRCPVRPEGHPEREACEAFAVGAAEDTGRLGPTWTRNGSYCTSKESNGCENHPDNQYLLWAYSGGLYEPCVKGGVCGSVQVYR